jgi:hypothetical protein
MQWMRLDSTIYAPAFIDFRGISHVTVLHRINLLLWDERRSPEAPASCPRRSSKWIQPDVADADLAALVIALPATQERSDLGGFDIAAVAIDQLAHIQAF